MEDAASPSKSAQEELTALRRQVADLQAAQEVASQIVETVREPLLVLTPDFRVQLANPAFYQLFQVRPTETIDQSIYQLGNGQWDIPKLHTLLEEILPQNTIFNDYEVRHDFERIGPRTILLNARRLDHAQFILLAMEDITVRKQAETQLRQAQRLDALGTLTGGLAHALNNLLAVILGYTELVHTNVAMDNQSRTNLQHVISATLRAKALLEQLLTFSRRTPIAPTPVSLTVAVRDTLMYLQTELPATLTLVHHLPVGPCLVLADATQLHEIVLQLGMNAVAAMRATGGQLDVRLEAVEVDAAGAATHPALHPGPYARLTLCDTGPGMPPEVLARICEPFFTTHGVGEGPGLGLAVVHGMVTYHGGVLVVESTLGEGTTCTLYLPRLVAPPEGDGPSSAFRP
jgi:signal transduction histidine kinase